MKYISNNVVALKRTYDLTMDNYCKQGSYLFRILVFTVTHTVTMQVLNEIRNKSLIMLQCTKELMT